MPVRIRAFGWAVAVACALPLASVPARAADAPPPAEVARLQGEIDRLKQEVAAQRQLILQLMQAEQQRYDVILKFLQTGGAPGADLSAALPPPPSAASVAPRAGEGGAGGSTSGGSAPAATITGRVKTSGSQPLGEAYVYVDGMRSSARGHTVEIKQRDKQFSPRVVVVPLGTKLLFPNQDTVIHNVFSTAPGNSFDIGSVKGGETSPPVVLLKPGPVEIFCNIHSKMRADVLVVPSGHYAKVRSDGSFELPGVPIGSRKVVLWSPALKPVSQRVEVTAEGATVSFGAELEATKPHTNKFGQPYGSYDE